MLPVGIFPQGRVQERASPWARFPGSALLGRPSEQAPPPHPGVPAKKKYTKKKSREFFSCTFFFAPYLGNHLFLPKQALFGSSGPENWWIRHRISLRSYWDTSIRPKGSKMHGNRRKCEISEKLNLAKSCFSA